MKITESKGVSVSFGQLFCHSLRIFVRESLNFSIFHKSLLGLQNLESNQLVASIIFHQSFRSCRHPYIHKYIYTQHISPMFRYYLSLPPTLFFYRLFSMRTSRFSHPQQIPRRLRKAGEELHGLTLATNGGSPTHQPTNQPMQGGKGHKFNEANRAEAGNIQVFFFNNCLGEGYD